MLRLWMAAVLVAAAYAQSQCGSQVTRMLQCAADKKPAPDPAMKARRQQRQARVSQCFDQPKCKDPVRAMKRFKACAKQQIGQKAGRQMQRCLNDKGITLPKDFLKGGFGGGKPGGRPGARRFGGSDGERPSRDEIQAKMEKKLEKMINKFCRGARRSAKADVYDCMKDLMDEAQSRIQSRLDESGGDEDLLGLGEGGEGPGEDQRAIMQACMGQSGFNPLQCGQFMKSSMCDCGKQLKTAASQDSDGDGKPDIQEAIQRCHRRHIGRLTREDREKAQKMKEKIKEKSEKFCSNNGGGFGGGSGSFGGGRRSFGGGNSGRRGGLFGGGGGLFGGRFRG